MADNPWSGIYEFAGFRLLAGQRRLVARADGRPIDLTQKAFDALLYLVRHPGELLDKATLLKAIWPNVVVEENNLNQVISTLRRALADGHDGQRFIVTVPGRGYQFVAEVRENDDPTAADRARAPVPATAAPTSTGSAQLASITVLPLANLTGDPGKEYFSDGMSEELIHRLSRVPGLRVTARTSSFAYKGKNVDVRQIGRDLGVETVLEGSVRSAGERIRVVAQLVNASTGFHVWSHSWDRQFEDMFKVQDELAGAIVRALGISANGSSIGTLPQAPPTNDLEAYQLYLQGIWLSSRPSEQNVLRAIELFEQASARDPNFTGAKAAAISQRLALTAWGFRPLPMAEVEREARQVLALDPGLAEGHGVLGNVYGRRGKFLEAEKHYQAVMSNASALPWLRSSYADKVLWPVGHLRQALRVIDESYRLAPTDSWIAALLAGTHMTLANDAEALRYARLAVDLGLSERLVLPIVHSYVALRARRYDEAAERMFAALPVALRAELDPSVLKLVYSALADASHKPAALAALRQLDVTTGEEPIDLVLQVQVHVMLLYTLLGALDRAFEQANRFLDRFAESGEIGWPGLWGTLWFPEMRPFRQDSRFAVLAERLGLMDYWKQYGPPDDCELSGGKLTCR